MAASRTSSPLTPPRQERQCTSTAPEFSSEECLDAIQVSSHECGVSSVNGHCAQAVPSRIDGGGNCVHGMDYRRRPPRVLLVRTPPTADSGRFRSV